ncbi:conjugal transfer protein TrbE [Klebsiella pneumoniae]|uniref:conjugal transfer protein TrbE n=1 Tax=Klebsiella pneumoniae TaxID=573 RepID=UPI000E2B388E|nr:conjugal transfer protein TrbE [Klebsiella pneumoniae]SVN77582.1 conjugal transfer protein TrbE [Klebsiella pneumoniae]
MKINFHKQPAIDFVLRLTLTIIIISPVIYFSWDAVKATSGSDYVESVVFIVAVGFFWFVSYGRCEQVPDMRSSYSSGAHPRGTS